MLKMPSSTHKKSSMQSRHSSGNCSPRIVPSTMRKFKATTLQRWRATMTPRQERRPEKTSSRTRRMTPLRSFPSTSSPTSHLRNSPRSYQSWRRSRLRGRSPQWTCLPLFNREEETSRHWETRQKCWRTVRKRSWHRFTWVILSLTLRRPRLSRRLLDMTMLVRAKVQWKKHIWKLIKK